MQRGKENPLIHGKVRALDLMEVPVDTSVLQICSAGRSISSSSLPLWQPALLPLALNMLSFNQTDFNSSVVPAMRRRFASLCLVPLSMPCSSSFTALQVFGKDDADCTWHICEKQRPWPPATASSLTWVLCIGRGKKTASPNDEFQASGFTILSKSDCKGMAPWERTGSSATGNFPLPAPVCMELGVSPSPCDGKDASSYNGNFIFKIREHRCFLSCLEYEFNTHSF